MRSPAESTRLMTGRRIDDGNGDGADPKAAVDVAGDDQQAEQADHHGAPGEEDRATS